MPGKWVRHTFSASSGNSYKIGRLHDDSGGMAEIYEARNPFSGKSLLAKVTRSKPESRANLNNEQRILNKIQNKKGIPTRSVSMIDHGTRDNEHFLILLNSDL